MIYNSKFVESGVDVQTKINEYLLTLLDKKDTYLDSKQFKEDKTYFNNALDEIESSKVKLVPFNDGFDELDEFIDNAK